MKVLKFWIIVHFGKSHKKRNNPPNGSKFNNIKLKLKDFYLFIRKKLKFVWIFLKNGV